MPAKYSEQTTDPGATCSSISGCKSRASTPSISSAHTFPDRYRMPKTGYLAVPRPRLLCSLCLTGNRLFLAWPPRYVSSTSTAPLKGVGISLAMTVRTKTNARSILVLVSLVSSIKSGLLYPRRNRWMSRRHCLLERCSGSLSARHSYRQAAQRLFPHLTRQLLAVWHRGQRTFSLIPPLNRILVANL